jgi:hypothetical protein
MRRTVLAVTASMLSLVCLAAFGAPAYAAQYGWGPVSIQSVLTRDGNGNAKSSFQFGDPIQYGALINNTSGQAQSATLTFDAYAPAPPGSPTSEVEIYKYSGNASVPPGVSGWYSPSTIPPSGPVSDQYHFYMTVAGPNSAFYSNDDVYFSVGMAAPQLVDNAGLDSQSVYPSITAGQSVYIYISARNTGTTTWLANGGGGYGYVGEDGWTGWGQRTFSHNVAPGGTYLIADTVHPPSQPGVYRYGFLLMHNGTRIGPYYLGAARVEGR